MNPEIAKRWEALEARREALVARVRALPKNKQNAKPASGLFSPVEIVKHFSLTEGLNLGFLEKNPPSSLAGKKAVTRFFYNMTVKKMQNPDHVLGTLPAMIPQGAVDLDEAAASWSSVRNKMKEYLDGVTDPNAAFIKMMFFFGTPSANDYLTLLEAHMHYHEVRFPA